MPKTRIRSARPSAEGKLLEIKKYPNRRYYDATRSRHVTIEEIHDLILQGNNIRVTESRTGQDITAHVLAQIILDLDPPKLEVFPVDMLHSLVRSNQQLVRDFVDKYFSHALDAFLHSQKRFEQYLRQTLGLQTAPAAQDWARSIMGPFMAPFFGAGAPAAAAPAREAGPGKGAEAPEGEDVSATLSALEREVASLRRRVGRAKRPGRKRVG